MTSTPIFSIAFVPPQEVFAAEKLPIKIDYIDWNWELKKNFLSWVSFVKIPHIHPIP